MRRELSLLGTDSARARSIQNGHWRRYGEPILSRGHRLCDVLVTRCRHCPTTRTLRHAEPRLDRHIQRYTAALPGRAVKRDRPGVWCHPVRTLGRSVRAAASIVQLTPTDYAGSRERDPHPEPTASLEHTAGKPARPDPPGANRRAPARLARHWQQHPNISARNPSNPTPSAALTVCAAAAYYCSTPNRSLLDGIPH